MPPVDDQNKDASTTKPAEGEQSSAATETPRGADTGAPAGSSQGAPAGESGKDEPKSALDAVLKVLAKDKPATDGQKPAVETTTTTVDEKEHQSVGEGEKDWLSREEYAALPQRARARMVNLTKQKNEFRDKAATFEPKAKTYDELSTYCRDHRLSPEDFSFALSLMSEIRAGSPAKAYEMLQPVIRDLQGHVGEILPADLEKEVAAGTLSEERATELAAARRERQRLERQGQERGEQDRQAAADRAVQENHNNVTGAIKGWEDAWKAKDPDYKQKAERVFERMVVLMQGKTVTPQLAVEIAEQAKKDVEGWLAGVLPKPKEVKPGPTGGTGGTTTKKAGSALEAAQQALEKTRVAA